MLMGKSLLLIGALCIVVIVVHAQDQSGFISIDCGLLPENFSYTEQNTGINYISDSKFIHSGISKSVSPGDKSTHQQQLSFLRSFPNGIRNCYRINVTIGTKYLIRASFLYGNYDGLNVLPQFDLHLGPNLWDTVKFTSSSLSTNSEIIHVSSLNYINICLVDTGNGTPFISAIEFRVLKNDTYEIAESSGSLARFLRLDLGSNTNATYRFKDDIYDRFWSPTAFNPRWSPIISTTTLTNDQLLQNDYNPAAIVMSTALTPTNSSASFDFFWDPITVNEKYYVYMHFNELQKLASNETRSFNISLNGTLFYGPLVPSYQTTTTVFSSLALTGKKRYLFSLFMTEASTLPPIINAIEIYIVKDFSQFGTQQDDVDAITNIKNAYKVDSNWQGDPCAPITYMWEGLNCSFESKNPPRITSLNLSSSGLTGQIATYISKLSKLQYLDLSNNSLSGPVPDFLTQLQSLKVLNLQNNNFTGSVPSELLDRSKKGSLSLSVGQNPNLCASASCNQQTDGNSKKKKSNVVIPVVASIAGVLVLVIVAAAIIFGLKKRKPQAAVISHVEHNINPYGSELETNKQRQYSYNELVKITDNFDRIIGRGGFGNVYHGFIENTQVAVKMLSASSVQGYQQFLAEVKLLMRVHHRNLTSLIGYCNEESSIGLIYEYMENGNLDEHLSGKNSKAKFLTWEDRLQIAVDAAQGLEYLHNGCKPQIIHRDVKCANILLNANFQAKLADFGLSKSFPNDGSTHVSTVVAGTPGYLDPEYTISNRLTEKSDVYSFGVVLLVIITGHPAITRTHDKVHISQFVSSMLSKGDIKSIVDSRLQGDYDTNSVWKAVEIAMASVSISSSKRPYMSDVVSELKDCLAKELARRQYSVSSENNKDSIGLTTNMASEIRPLAR